MSGRLLDFKNYVGGSDNVQVLELFADTQQTFTYDYNVDISNYTFTVEHQTLVVDQVSYDRSSGLPVFSESNVTGFFANVTGAAGLVTNRNNSAGTVNITIPEDRYTGQLLPNARTNVPITVLSVTWSDSGVTNPNVSTHRWAILERYKPGASTVGDPELDPNFLKIGVGAVAAFSSNASTDTNRTAGSYTITGLSSSNGTGATFAVFVKANGDTDVDIVSRGTGYRANETIELLDENMGAGGGADITVTVTSVS